MATVTELVDAIGIRTRLPDRSVLGRLGWLGVVWEGPVMWHGK
jgi:hypothetical protein